MRAILAFHAVTAATVCATTMASADDIVRANEHVDAPPVAVAHAPAFENALRLARMLRDERVVARLLESHAMARGASSAEVAEVVASLEAVGDPQRAAKLLEQRISAFPNEDDSRRQLAELLGRSGHADRAVTGWRDLEQRVGLARFSTREIDDYARALSAAGDDDGAFRVLASVAKTAPADAVDYWEDVAALASARDELTSAHVAYQKLWDADKGHPQWASMLVALALKDGSVRDALPIAIETFQRNRDLEPLLRIVRVQIHGGDWTGARATLGVLSDSEVVAHDEDYWILRGEILTHVGDPSGAREAFTKAIALDAKSDARDTLLWDAIDRGDMKALREYVTRWNPNDSKDPDLKNAYLDLTLRHAVHADLGGSYDYIAGLDVAGPNLGVSHDFGPARMVYTASERELLKGSAPLQMSGPVAEGDLFVLARFIRSKGVTEGGAGVNVQAATPAPRASFFDAHAWGTAFETTVHLALDERIDDTSLLRVGGLQALADVAARYDPNRLLYGELELHAREDHTRRFHHIGSEAGETAEVGVKLVRSEPEWDLGLQALARQRENVATFSPDIASLVAPGANTSDLLPPSYELFSVVTRLTRGDFLQRYQPDGTPFPRYECSVALGILLPSSVLAGDIECSLALLVWKSGYVSMTGSLDRGIAGLADQTTALTSLSYTQAF